MDKDNQEPQTRVNASWQGSLCKLPTCKTPFIPARKDQVFHSPKCKAEFYRDALTKGVKVMQAGRIHLARIEYSERLQRILKVLEDGQPHSTLDIQNRAKVCAVGTSISELRNQGYDIRCKIKPGRIFTYELKEPL